jgi:hypothetical protein
LKKSASTNVLYDLELNQEEFEKIVKGLYEAKEAMRYRKEADLGDVIVGGCVLNEDNIKKNKRGAQQFPFGEDEDLFDHEDFEEDDHHNNESYNKKKA